MVTDWKEVDLTTICGQDGIVRGPFGGSLKKEMFVNKGYKVYEQGNAIKKDVTYGDYFITEEKYHEMKRFSLLPGDFIVSCSGTIGKIFQIPLNAPKGIINQALLKLSVKDKVINDSFFYQYFIWETFNKKVIDDTQGGAMKNLVGMDKFKKTTLFIPKKIHEQKAIATALSDMDNLIADIEKLIAKKKAIKQGAMQDLLTGKKRLPGFSGEWKNMVIGENGYLQKGSINPQLQPEKYFYEYSMPAFDETMKPSHVQGKTMHSNRSVISGKVLLFNKLNVRQRRVWLIDECESDAICSGEFLPYTSEKIDLKLLSQILLSDKVTEDFIGMSTGSSNSQKRITPKSFLDYSLYLPIDVEEQKALASVFDDMDNEIIVLQTKLEKYHCLKQGMMNKLLTGEIRLI